MRRIPAAHVARRQSGVTIGIGYDLGMTPKAQITSAWEPLSFRARLAALLAVQGVTGGGEATARGCRAIVIPFAAAEEVFCIQTLPSFAARTRAAFPGVKKFPADAQGVMLSLVYNRGASLKGEQRREWPRLRGCCVARTGSRSHREAIRVDEAALAGYQRLA